ncbi:hypothetical protein K1X76_01535 [bacterium]|nr:hypothetical protein [bacterium]
MDGKIFCNHPPSTIHHSLLFLSLESFIARRFFNSQKKSGLVLVLALVALIGSTLSVFSVLSIHAVMNGFSHHLREAIIGFKAPLTIKNIVDQTEMEEVKKIVMSQGVSILRTTEVLEFDGILETGDGDTAGVRFRGGLPEANNKLTVDFFEPYTQADIEKDQENWILLGEDLFSRVNLLPDAGNGVKITFPFAEIGPTGEMEPKQKIMTVFGTFKSGYYDFDTQYGIMSVNNLKVFTQNSQALRTLAVYINPEQADGLKLKLEALLPNQKISTWTEDNQKLFQALKLEKMGMFLLLFLVIIVASFNILGLIGLFAVRKLSDLSVLFALGFTRKRMARIFSIISIALGLTGTLLGMGLALLFLNYVRHHPVVLPSAYAVETLPVLIDYRLFMAMLFAGPLITYVAGMVPLGLVRSFSPLEILRKFES